MATYITHMRSYGQYCGLARALDLVGERWTLLIVRELLMGPRRYTDLHRGLPGIATNLLATRLVDMEEAGLEVQHYRGRFYWEGPAVAVDDLQDALGATKVRCQWDHLGLGWIVYPKAYGNVQSTEEDEAQA